MYDIAIELLSTDSTEVQKTDINFRILYIDGDYTWNQCLVRATFVVLSAIVMIAYSTKVLCRVP